MTDDEWSKQRDRAVMAAFQTGRPVFADNAGELRYVDGSGEQVPEEIGQASERVVQVAEVPRATSLAVRAQRASHWAFVMSVVAATANAVAAVWNPWQIVAVVGFAGSAVVWHRVSRYQRKTFPAGGK